MTTLKLENDRDRGNEFFQTLRGNDGGVNFSWSICHQGFQHESDVPPTAANIWLVTSENDPGGPDVWDIRRSGRIGTFEVLGAVQIYLKKRYRAGERFLTVYYSTREYRGARCELR